MANKPKDKKVASAAFLTTYKGLFGLNQPEDELKLKSIVTDNIGMHHLKYDQ